MNIELEKDGYARLDAGIQTIEDMAYNVMFSEKREISQFYRIVQEARKLRETLKDVVMLSPRPGEGDAA